ncbi:MAG: hypothetical protein OXT09_09210 [Myxococcales bacterium]|nr:hypothetical protein [Myxococcales bacterium]
MASMFERLGGEAKLRPLIDDFVDRVFDDVMIGFFFRSASRERIKRFEYEHAAQFLGAEIEYGGRPLRQAHARQPIMGGQFARRMRILEQTLSAHGVPEDIAQAWLAHNRDLREEITADPEGECHD